MLKNQQFFCCQPEPWSLSERPRSSGPVEPCHRGTARLELHAQQPGPERRRARAATVVQHQQSGECVFCISPPPQFCVFCVFFLRFLRILAETRIGRENCVFLRILRISLRISLRIAYFIAYFIAYSLRIYLRNLCIFLRILHILHIVSIFFPYYFAYSTRSQSLLKMMR
jgi:hypothetical protein